MLSFHTCFFSSWPLGLFLFSLFFMQLNFYRAWSVTASSSIFYGFGGSKLYPEPLIFKILGICHWLWHSGFGLLVPFGILSISVLVQHSHFKFVLCMTHHCLRSLLPLFSFLIWGKVFPPGIKVRHNVSSQFQRPNYLLDKSCIFGAENFFCFFFSAKTGSLSSPSPIASSELWTQFCKSNSN